MADELTVSELSELASHESVIEYRLKTIETGFVEIGEELKAIREKRLYRQTYATWDAYCKGRWNIRANYANSLIQASVIINNLTARAVNLPRTEFEARPLAVLSPEEQIQVWQEFSSTTPPEKISGRALQRYVDEYRDRLMARKETPELSDEEFNREQIIEANRAGWAIGVPANTTSQPVEVTIFSHKSIEYYTPIEFLDAAREVMGGIDLDPASCDEAQMNVRAKAFFTKEDDGLGKPWYGRVWLNPPYSKTDGRSNQDVWSQRLASEYEAGRVTQAVLLVKAALGYQWFERLWYRWPVCFAKTRLSFIREDGDDHGESKQGTAFLYFGRNVSRFIDVFRQFGRVILPNDGYGPSLSE